VVAERWLLIETFGGEQHDEPAVIAVGGVPKRMVPLAAVLGRGRYLNDVRALVARVVASGQPVRTMSTDGRRRLVGDPLIAFSGLVHGVYAWTGDPAEEPPARDPAGAWYFNLTTGKIGGSDDLLDLYGVAPQDRRSERMLAEAFNRLITNADEAAGLAVIVKAQPGDEHQATWTVRRDDGQLRAVNFACRSVQELNPDGDPEVVLRGISHDIGEADSTPSAPPRQVLAQQVLDAQKEPGKHRAIANLRTLALLRWLDDPMPGLAWQNDGQYAPGFHPDDLPAAKAMSKALARDTRATDVLRLRSVTGAWMPVRVEACVLRLDQDTTAALVTLSASPGVRVEPVDPPPSGF
jgi:hypothetical protein